MTVCTRRELSSIANNDWTFPSTDDIFSFCFDFDKWFNGVQASQDCFLSWNSSNVININSITTTRNLFDKASIQCIECEFYVSKSWKILLPARLQLHHQVRFKLHPKKFDLHASVRAHPLQQYQLDSTSISSNICCTICISCIGYVRRCSARQVCTA